MQNQNYKDPLLQSGAGNPPNSYGSTTEGIEPGNDTVAQYGNEGSTPSDNANNQALENWQFIMCSITFTPACVALLWLCCLVHGHVMPSSNSTNTTLVNDTSSLRQPPF